MHSKMTVLPIIDQVAIPEHKALKENIYGTKYLETFFVIKTKILSIP